MLTRPDVIYFIEQRFSCRQGRPYKSQDPEGMNRYVTLMSHGNYAACSAAFINAMGAIADRHRTKLPLWWRMVTKVDDDRTFQRMSTRIYIEGVDNYGPLRNDSWRPIYPTLVWSRPPAFVVELRDEVKKHVFPVLTHEPQPPNGVA